MSKFRIINPAASSFKNVSKNAKAMSAGLAPVQNYSTVASTGFSNIYRSNTQQIPIRVFDVITPPPPPTFIYTFNNYASLSDNDIKLIIPIINVNNSFTNINTIVENQGAPNIKKVTITFDFTDNGTTNDGLSFMNVFNNFSNNDLNIIQFGNIPLSRGGLQFYGLSNLSFSASDTPIILSNTNLTACFGSCSYFNANINNWDTSNVINMEGMFRDAPSFNNGDSNGASNYPLNFNTSNVTNMEYMFNGAKAFNQKISRNNNFWNTFKVENMRNTFTDATNFNNGNNPLLWYTNALSLNPIVVNGINCYDIAFRSGSNLTRSNGIDGNGIQIGNDY